jgi:hypothetical protein
MTAMTSTEVTGPEGPRYDEILAPEPLSLIATLFTEVALADSFADFLTVPAYERVP